MQCISGALRDAEKPRVWLRCNFSLPQFALSRRLWLSLHVRTTGKGSVMQQNCWATKFSDKTDCLAIDQRKPLPFEHRNAAATLKWDIASISSTSMSIIYDYRYFIDIVPNLPALKQSCVLLQRATFPRPNAKIKILVIVQSYTIYDLDEWQWWRRRENPLCAAYEGWIITFSIADLPSQSPSKLDGFNNNFLDGNFRFGCQHPYLRSVVLCWASLSFARKLPSLHSYRIISTR